MIRSIAKYMLMQFENEKILLHFLSNFYHFPI